MDRLPPEGGLAVVGVHYRDLAIVHSGVEWRERYLEAEGHGSKPFGGGWCHRDGLQFTVPASELKVANRELGTVVGINEGRMVLPMMEDDRSVAVDPLKHSHLDHGYTVTSHSSQGQTAERALVHVDTELAAKDLLNNRMAYVAVSRGAHDAQVFTIDRKKLPVALEHEVSQKSAHMPEVTVEQVLPKVETAPRWSLGAGRDGM